MAVITDSIAERTPDAGVTVDGLLIKNGALPDVPGAALTADQSAALAAYEIALGLAEAGQVLTASGPGAAAFVPVAGITWCYSMTDLVDGNMVDDDPLEIVVANYIPEAAGATMLCCLAQMEEFNGVGRVQLQGNMALLSDPLAYVVIGEVEANSSVTFPVFLVIRDGSVYVKRNSLSGGSAGVWLTPLFFA